MTTSPTWLERYLEGESQAIWHELRQLGARVREPEFAREAQAVCDEMARRARSNLEIIVERLLEQGYRFHTNDAARDAVDALVSPAADADRFVEWMEQTFGSIPMTLSSWVRIVGDVWLVGTHPDWPASASADPLVIEVAGTRYPGESMRSYLVGELHQWREESGEPFELPVAPDRLHKDNVSGGPPYGIVLPDDCADAHIVADAGTPFVSYLRKVFDAGGFPYWTGDERQRAVQRSLAAGLKPL